MFLTRRQQQVLSFIREHIRAQGFAPTLDEMARHFGLTRVTLHEHIKALEKKGLLRRHPHKARGLELIESTERPGLTVRGVVNAGPPALACEDVDQGVLSDWIEDRAGRYFLLRVRGDSMVGDHITDGDFVVVDARRSPKPGDLVVARDEDGQATLKRLGLGPDHVRLEPSNPEYSVIRMRDPAIVGVVTGIIRRL